MNEAGKKPTVFISYSHKDEDWKERLVTHLGVAQKQGIFFAWEDRLIGGGEDWQQEIQGALNAASVAILLVSAHSLTSEFILHEEVERMLDRRKRDGLRIFPVVIKPCDWEAVPWLKQMNLRPRDGRPISGGSDYQIDTDLTAIAKEIRLLLNSVEQTANTEHHASPAPNKISLGRLPITGRQLFGRDEQLKQLDEAWADAHTNIISLVAWGGVGKSALVNHWLAKMASDNYRGATRAYGWSFYSQGTTDRAVSADQFIEAALTWFGDKDPNKGSPWDKGERLAGLIGAQRTLLVLDGLEPLQYPPGADEGRLKDQALQSLLRQLAAYNEGLCVISTRVAVTDLSPFEGSTVARIDLEQLSPEAGAQILTAQGVKSKQAELEQASREFDGHSLALTLLGSYLSDVYGGDVSRRKEVSDLEGEVRYGGHARRVMSSYEKWLGEGPELAVLRILGLFNRPADKEAIDALRAAPAIFGLTNTLQDLSETKWQRVLAKLRRAKLLAEPSPNQPSTLDTHPLVREHFGQQLKRNNPDAWREGNSRLYEHLKRTAKEFPDTIEEMAPLYAAVAHGCEAGRYQEAIHEVYYGRVCRGAQHFSWKKLGTFGADLAALTSFFDPPWQKPISAITDDYKAFVLHQVGLYLRAMGRLTEAIQPMQAGLEAYLSLESWENAAISAGSLSELYLTIGNMQHALDYAEQSVELADKSGDSFQSMSKRTTLAEALHQVGRLSEAEATFREAEQRQKALSSKLTLLYSLWGYRYCNLLIEQGKYQEVQSRALQTLQWAKQYGDLLSNALDHLSLGRAYLLQVQDEKTSDYTHATDYLNQAVDGLRLAGQLNYLPLGLLARAQLRILKRDFSRARIDLDEVMSIAVRGSMELHQADCHLGYARLYLAEGEREKERESLETAREMIERMGYHRRDKDVEEIERQIGRNA